MADALAGGAVVACGGHRLAPGSHFFAPTVLADVTPDMEIMREEVFGPVLPIVPFTDLDAAVAGGAAESGVESACGVSRGRPRASLRAAWAMSSCDWRVMRCSLTAARWTRRERTSESVAMPAARTAASVFTRLLVLANPRRPIPRSAACVIFS